MNLGALILFTSLYSTKGFMPPSLGSKLVIKTDSTKLEFEPTMGDSSRRNAIGQLIGASLIIFNSPRCAFAYKYEYLEEPTEAFKENERKAMEFRRAQIEIKKNFMGVLERFTTNSKTEQDIVDCLEDLKVLVKRTEGLPVGLKKDEIIKTIRAKKRLGNWTTPMEIAYQSLLREIEYQQSPNTGGSMEDKMNYSIN